jgi:hypothetical protein
MSMSMPVPVPLPAPPPPPPPPRPCPCPPRAAREAYGFSPVHAHADVERASARAREAGECVDERRFDWCKRMCDHAVALCRLNENEHSNARQAL